LPLISLFLKQLQMAANPPRARVLKPAKAMRTRFGDGAM
jgi:hypothetical protein